MYRDLRTRVLDTDPAEVGIPVVEGRPWGGLFEMGIGGNVATVVALADGTTSMYVSTGGGVIGGGQHDTVREATWRFLEALTSQLGQLTETDAGALTLPVSGAVQFVALLPDGAVRVAQAHDTELRGGRHALSPVYLAGQDVITQLRLTSP